MTEPSDGHMTIVIAGTGRAGTSVLMKLFNALGFTSGALSGWDEKAQAGLEARFSLASEDVVKDPWFVEYMDDLSSEEVASISYLIIPIRNREDAVTSRLIQERTSRLRSDGEASDRWKWRTTDTGVAGGIVVGGSFRDVSGSIGESLWDLLEWATRNQVRVQLLHFPRFVENFDYFWGSMVGLLEGRIGRDEAERAWVSIADVKKVRVSTTDFAGMEHLTKPELVGIVHRLQRENTHLTKGTAAYEVQLQQARESAMLLERRVIELSDHASTVESELARVRGRRSVKYALAGARLFRPIFVTWRKAARARKR